MEFSRREEIVIAQACQAEEAEVVQLLDAQLAVIGGGIADVTLS